MKHTAEFVSPLHPDKICDRISDSILDAYLKKHQAKEVIIKIAYAIGKQEPVMTTGTIDGNAITFTGNMFSPKNIIDKFDLYSPVYTDTATWGAFGNGFKWDK